ncbi:MAG: hypothetical protein L3J39_06285 [Verrucomicrobiales bacterium]|nr:hypothetical protein [Verrucomicrobiales bacterium]
MDAISATKQIKRPRAGVFIYGDLLNKKTVRWKAPGNLKRSIMDIIWVDAESEVDFVK